MTHHVTSDSITCATYMTRYTRSCDAVPCLMDSVNKNFTLQIIPVLYIIEWSICKPHHIIWQFEMVPWSMRKINTRRNKNDRCMCLLADNGSIVHNQDYVLTLKQTNMNIHGKQ